MVGVFVPAATPPEIVAKLHRALSEIINMPEIRSRLADLGADPVGDTPAEFSEFVRSESAKFTRIVKATNMTVN